MGLPEKLLDEGEHVVVPTRQVVDDGVRSAIGVVVGVLAVVVLVRWVLRPFVRWCTTTYTFFGCGTLVVSDTGEEGRVPLDDIPDVEKVQRRVAQKLHRSTVPGRDDDGI